MDLLKQHFSETVEFSWKSCIIVCNNVDYRQDRAQRGSADIVFTQGPVFRVFVSQGRHVALIKVKFGRGVRSSLQNFTLIGLGVWVYGP